MKNLKVLAVLCLVTLASCSPKEGTFKLVSYTVGKPITISFAELRASIEVQEPQAMVESGKMYRYGDYVFVNENNEGIHVIKGLGEERLEKVKFIKIPGNKDVAVRDGYLYADSYVDLVVFDISDINNIQLVNILENVFPNIYFNYVEGADWFDFSEVDFENEIIIGWELEKETLVVQVFDDWFESGGVSAGTGAADIGNGGSLARFKIVGNYLYAVDQANLNVFEISNLSEPISIGTEYVGQEIETIFNQGEYLFIGSSSGLFIYNISTPSDPQLTSTISHILGCDPVVVQDDYAYVTIRGGNFCGQEFSQLEVIDVSDKANPFIETTVDMVEPYGLGVRNESLYVSDGEAGLKLFNIADPQAIFLEDQFEDVHVLDIIPLEDKLLMVGDNTLYIYHYIDANLELVLTFNLD